jgi:UDP-glucose 4-epimerase
VAESFSSPVAYARAHVVGTATLLDACRDSEVRRVTLVSSAEVYGSPDADLVSEDHALRPQSPYGAAKLGAEAFVRALAPDLGIDAVVLRPFSVYGPHLGRHTVLASIIRQAMLDDQVIVADTRPVRDYCYVDDLAEAAVMACLRPLPDAVSTYNIASGRGISVLELARLVVQKVGHPMPILRAESSDRPAHAVVPRMVADVSAARRDLGWTPTTDLSQGLLRTIEWFRNEYCIE